MGLGWVWVSYFNFRWDWDGIGIENFVNSMLYSESSGSAVGIPDKSESEITQLIKKSHKK